MARIASATGVPCATRTSTWRSLEMISSGVCLFLRIVILLRPQSHTSGWTTPTGADHSPLAVNCTAPLRLSFRRAGATLSLHWFSVEWDNPFWHHCYLD